MTTFRHRVKLTRPAITAIFAVSIFAACSTMEHAVANELNLSALTKSFTVVHVSSNVVDTLRITCDEKNNFEKLECKVTLLNVHRLIPNASSKNFGKQLCSVSAYAVIGEVYTRTSHNTWKYWESGLCEVVESTLRLKPGGVFYEEVSNGREKDPVCETFGRTVGKVKMFRPLDVVNEDFPMECNVLTVTP